MGWSFGVWVLLGVLFAVIGMGGFLVAMMVAGLCVLPISASIAVLQHMQRKPWTPIIAWAGPLVLLPFWGIAYAGGGLLAMGYMNPHMYSRARGSWPWMIHSWHWVVRASAVLNQVWPTATHPALLVAVERWGEGNVASLAIVLAVYLAFLALSMLETFVRTSLGLSCKRHPMYREETSSASSAPQSASIPSNESASVK